MQTPRVSSSGPTAASRGKSTSWQSGRFVQGGRDREEMGQALGGKQHASLQLGNFHYSSSKLHRCSTCYEGSERHYQCLRQSFPTFGTFLVSSVPFALGKAAFSGESCCGNLCVAPPLTARLEGRFPFTSSGFSHPLRFSPSNFFSTILSLHRQFCFQAVCPHHTSRHWPPPPAAASCPRCLHVPPCPIPSLLLGLFSLHEHSASVPVETKC